MSDVYGLKRLNRNDWAVFVAPAPDVVSYLGRLFTAVMNRPEPILLDLTTDEIREVRDHMTQDLRKH
jgi:hypothetical protein